MDLLRGLFKSDLSRRFIAPAYMTGILPIKKYNSESALNNFDEFTMTSPAMLAGSRCRVNINTYENDMTSFKSKDDVLTMLIHLGYLAYDSAKREVYIPNEEVREAFVQAVENSCVIEEWRKRIRKV